MKYSAKKVISIGVALLTLLAIVGILAISGSDLLSVARAMYNRLTATGAVKTPAAFQTVGTNINISRRMGSEDESTIFINPVNPNQLVSLSNVDGNGLFRAFSTDGGATWTGGIIANGDALGTACCDPQATGCFDTFGNFILTYLDQLTSPPTPATSKRIQTAISTDGGATFTFLATIATTTAATNGFDQPSIAFGAGTVWVSFRDAAGTISASGAMVTGLGAAGVGAFSAPQVAPGSANGNFGDIAVAPGGGVMVSYQIPSGGAAPGSVFVNFDPDGLGPLGFGPAVLATATNVAGFDFIPAQSNRSVDIESGLAYDRSGGPRNGRVYLVYTDETPEESNDMDIFVRFSDDNGANWSPRVRVNDDATTRSQFNPRIALDQTTGNIAVSWYDCRNDAGAGAGDTNGTANDDAQLWATFSINGGATFLPNIRVSGGTSNADAAGTAMDFGDYAGLTFHNGAAFPSWADNSNSTGDNPNGALARFDIYTAQIQLCAITCPVNITAGNAPNQCGAVVTYSAPTTNGGCGTVSCAPASGAFFPVGATTVTCTVSGGPSCSFTVTVNDTQNPVITCPANITKSTDPGLCSAIISPGTATATDNCPGMAVTGTRSDALALAAPYPRGITTITWKATDASGNMATCVQTITVNDTEAPKIICPANVTAVTPKPGDPATTVVYPPPTVTDNCPGAAAVCSPPSSSSFPLGVTTVTCTATDTSGNTAGCSFTVTVFDVCLQDDKSGDFLLFNSFTGDYFFNRCGPGGFTMVGRGRITRVGCSTKLEDDTRVISAEIDRCIIAPKNMGSAALKRPIIGTTFLIKDGNILNNTCVCP